MNIRRSAPLHPLTLSDRGWVLIPALTGLLATWSILNGLAITDAPNASASPTLVIIPPAILAGLVALGISLRSEYAAYGIVVGLGVIASGGLCCLGSVGVESSNGASDLLLASTFVGIGPSAVAAALTAIGRNARAAKSLDVREGALSLLGIILCASGIFGLWWGWQLGFAFVSAIVAVLGFVTLCISVAIVRRGGAFLARIAASDLAQWRVGSLVGIDPSNVPAWFAAPDEVCLYFDDASGTRGPFRDGHGGSPFVRIPSIEASRKILRGQFGARLLALGVICVVALGAIASGGHDQPPYPLRTEFPGHYAFERFDTYRVPGLDLWLVRPVEHGEGEVHGADVVGYDRRARTVVRGPALYRRAGRLSPTDAARRAADMVLHAALARIRTIRRPTVQNGLLTFELDDEDGATPEHATVSYDTGEVVHAE